MKRIAMIALASFAVGTVVGVSASQGVAAQVQIRAVKLAQLLKTDLAGCEGKEVTVSIIDAGDGASPRHYHPGDSFTYMLEGQQLHETAQGQRHVQAGDVIHDKAGEIHRTETLVPVKLLVVRVLDKGQPENIVVK
jgi:quercetin dioxygenase-like cupin family protein